MSGPDVFAPIPLFSYPLYSMIVAGHEQHKEGLLAEIFALQARHPGVKRSNRNAWHSPDNFASAETPHVGWVLRNALAFAKGALGRHYRDWASHEPRLAQFWANVVAAGGWNAPHHHFPYHWSGVYYVHVGPAPEAADDLSGMIEFQNPGPWSALYGLGGNFAQRPKDGGILIFPAPLVHFVHPHANEDAPRVSIAFNFTIGAKST